MLDFSEKIVKNLVFSKKIFIMRRLLYSILNSMKKALIALVALTFLASCGNKAAETVKTDTQTTVKTESVSATTEGVQVESSGSTETTEATTATSSSSASLSAGCDDYVKYYSCAMEKSGFTGDALTQAVDELKKGFAELPADLQTQACTQGLDAFKQSMPVSGC